MPLHSYFVVFAFTVLFLVFAGVIIRLSNFRTGIIGTPSIDKLYFYAAKIAVFSTWALFILKAIFPNVGYYTLPDFFSWIAVVLLYLGVIILSISFINLGNALKFGLPVQETKLQTRGLYRISRNPLYVGVYLMAIGSCIYFPDLINITFTIYTIYIHHIIIREEERFLSERFGEDWVIYSSKVSRYI
jgi:protein-S-isoprenylcysteine O-methyltransferase Ste14